MPIDAGKLDRRVKLMRSGPDVDNGYSKQPGPPELLAERWARVLPGRGSERFESAKNAASAVTQFVIRWSSEVADLNPKDFIEYPVDSGRRYDIQAVNEIGRREGLEILAVAQAD